MSDTVIKVENLGKKYIIAHQQQERYTALRDVIAHRTKTLLNPFQKTKSKIQNSQEEFWALNDVSFEIKQGDRVGVIGRNGAGKSTLLKILSRITEPTTGRVSINGRIASLLEVGTGFHPELTGRENIFLNGAILGMSKTDIKKKFDEIVAFAEVEKFLDTPVKRYSSGMYVRLAFAVAAHLEPEILVVDEVLAVGDAAFQKKCLGKMEEVGKEGRTVLFVSHSMGSISQLTTKCLFLANGKKVGYGLTQEIVTKYIESSYSQLCHSNFYSKDSKNYDQNKLIEFSQIKIDYHNNSLACEISYIVREAVKSVVAVKVTNSQGITVITVRDTDDDPNYFSKQKGNYMTQFVLPVDNWVPGLYFLTLSLADMVSKRYDFLEEILSFEVSLNNDDTTPGWSRDGIIFDRTFWKTIQKVPSEV
ncbi:ABC transporter ATP-binding protein [Scytonema hofmannii PCC 7110]|uniref:ABC transporter ATP-binding protein n=1 Tax=Scytonema hofmannii PCC 7110 TaxID=128403 RepID=A0A139WWP1_9CYAN|nr:polysaccharide ABC transporter ATP-binding protein [Scytonema hofmannii]KYC36856.1 ABC transporter ATP-binding protein [Scytonema hofmannii PCC 7110]